MPSSKEYQALVFVNCCDYDGNEFTDEKQAAQYVLSTFKSEYFNCQHNIRKGRQVACSDWLQGLPSVCTVPFYYAEIQQWAEKVDNCLLSDKEAERLFNRYFGACANALFVMAGTSWVKANF